MQESREKPVESSLCHLKKSTLNRWAIDTLFWTTEKSVHQYLFHIQISLRKVKRFLRNARHWFIWVPASNVPNNHFFLFPMQRRSCYWNQSFIRNSIHEKEPRMKAQYNFFVCKSSSSMEKFIPPGCSYLRCKNPLSCLGKNRVFISNKPLKPRLIIETEKKGKESEVISRQVSANTKNCKLHSSIFPN